MRLRLGDRRRPRAGYSVVRAQKISDASGIHSSRRPAPSRRTRVVSHRPGLFPSNELSFLALALVSWVVLPAWAGFRVARAGGGPRLATLGGISISAVTLTCATLAELLFTRDFPTLGGLALATVLIAVPIQALSGLLACWVRTRRAGHGV